MLRPFVVADQRPVRLAAGRAELRLVNLLEDLALIELDRLVEILETWKDQPLTPAVVGDLLRATRVRLEASRAHVGITFTYFKEKAAPVSGQRSTMGYTCQVDATVDGDQLDLVIGAE